MADDKLKLRAREVAEKLLGCLELQAVEEQPAGEAAYDGTCTVATFKMSDRGIELLATFAELLTAEAQTKEAKWWAGKWNQECGLCSEALGCTECKEPHKRIAELESTLTSLRTPQTEEGR